MLVIQEDEDDLRIFWVEYDLNIFRLEDNLKFVETLVGILSWNTTLQGAWLGLGLVLLLQELRSWTLWPDHEGVPHLQQEPLCLCSKITLQIFRNINSYFPKGQQNHSCGTLDPNALQLALNISFLGIFYLFSLSTNAAYYPYIPIFWSTK